MWGASRRGLALLLLAHSGGALDRAFGRTQGELGALMDESHDRGTSWCLAPRPTSIVRETYVHYNGTKCVPFEREDHRCRGVEVPFAEPYEYALSPDMLARSRSTMGHVGRFRNFLCKLWSQKPTTVLTLCGSNCGRAYLETIVGPKGPDGRPISWDEESWPGRFEYWLNKAFPTADGEDDHQVINMGMGGVGTCGVARRVKSFMASMGDTPDLIVVEFSINDADYPITPPFGGERYSRDSVRRPRCCNEFCLTQPPL